MERSSAVDVQAFLASHPQTRTSSEEIARRAEVIYATMQEHIDTPENLGRYFSIDIDTGDTELGDRHETAHILRSRHPNAVIYTLKIGYPAAVSMTGMMRPLPQ